MVTFAALLLRALNFEAKIVFDTDHADVAIAAIEETVAVQLLPLKHSVDA
jgi:hypothetical protein